MLPSEPTCDITDEVCCDSFFELADALLEVVHTAMLDCYDGECEIASFVSVGEPVFTAGGDYVSVWVSSVDWTGLPDGRGGTAHRSRPRVTFGVKVMESGWPTLETAGGPIQVPEPDRMHLLAKHSMAHIELVVRRVNTSVRDHSWELTYGSTYQGLGPVRPTQRTSGLVGWTFTVTMEVEWRPMKPLPGP